MTGMSGGIILRSKQWHCAGTNGKPIAHMLATRLVKTEDILERGRATATIRTRGRETPGCKRACRSVGSRQDRAAVHD
jgi:hypothetical protein